ncbi:MAG: prephenate dehydrogenase/arogenate dehydrogenase family protein [Candidatus Omnitrophica bacterium]|jgi:prephenate dehydrogenase|nr:prephenate dehydrogenase/arogenate dehydrogenase family protein [Candidatus Omnitrophota bacterium]
MPEFENIGIVGLGFLGGSLGLAIKKRYIAKKVLGLTRTHETLIKSEKIGAIDKGFTSFKEFINEVDFLILCAPVLSNNKYIKDIISFKPELFFTDIGSTKSSIVKYVDSCFSDYHNFVGSHPIAGSEKKGIDFSNSDIFENKIIILTPGEKSSPLSVSGIEKFWKSLGGKTFIMDSEKHDEILAYTSHFPHAVIFTLCKTLEEKINNKEFSLSVGSGLKDTTRIASSSVEMWEEIFLDNSLNVLLLIEKFKKELDEFEDILKSKDISRLEKYLYQAKNIRKIIEQNGQKKYSEKS